MPSDPMQEAVKAILRVLDEFRGSTALALNGAQANRLSQPVAALRSALSNAETRPALKAAGGWRDIERAPKDGTHILACVAGTSFGWLDGKAAPAVQTVVHWWANPGEEGFYTSVNELEPQNPFKATHWKPLDELGSAPEAGAWRLSREVIERIIREEYAEAHRTSSVPATRLCIRASERLLALGAVPEGGEERGSSRTSPSAANGRPDSQHSAGGEG